MEDCKEPKLFISSKLTNVVRKLDYKQHYKVCYAFYDEIIKYPQFDDNKHCLKFDEIYESLILIGLTKRKTRYNSV